MQITGENVAYHSKYAIRIHGHCALLFFPLYVHSQRLLLPVILLFAEFFIVKEKYKHLHRHCVFLCWIVSFFVSLSLAALHCSWTNSSIEAFAGDSCKWMKTLRHTHTLLYCESRLFCCIQKDDEKNTHSAQAKYIRSAKSKNLNIIFNWLRWESVSELSRYKKKRHKSISYIDII